MHLHKINTNAMRSAWLIRNKPLYSRIIVVNKVKL